MKYSVLIVEDVPLIAKRVERLSKEILNGQIEKLEVVYSLAGAEDYIDSEPIDILLLDLNLNGENGFGLLKKAVSKSFHTIVITANKQEAIQAFELGVLDFISKPITQERLEKSFLKLKQSQPFREFKTAYLSVKNHGEIELIPIESIETIQSSSPYSEIMLGSGKIYYHEKSLDHLIQTLPLTFQRVHKSSIVNLSAIEKYLSHGGGKYEIILKNKRHVAVGRSYAQKLKELL